MRRMRDWKTVISNTSTYSKKAALLGILEILKSKASSGSGIDQSEIIEELEYRYGIRLNRETVGRNLDILLEFYPDNITFRLNNAQKRCGWQWHERRQSDFDPAEIRLLLGAVECYGKLDPKYKHDLMRRIAKLSSDDISIASMPKSLNKPSKKNDRYRLFYNIGILGEAIVKRKLVTFSKGVYDKDGIIRKAKGSEARSYTVCPNAIAFKNNTYMLISTFGDNEYPYVMHSSIDTMFDVVIISGSSDNDMPALEDKLANMQKYLDEHLYMYSDDPIRITIRIFNNPVCIRQMYEQFGLAVVATHDCEDDRYIDFVVREPETPMVFWALQYSDMAEILEPESLRKRIAEQTKELENKYGR